MSVSEIVPDYMSALVGYRAWDVTPEGDLLSLNSNTSEPWPAKTRKGAMCTQLREETWGPSQLVSSSVAYMTTSGYGDSSIIQSAVLNFAAWWNHKAVQKANANHHAPEAGCSCGVYAAKAENQHFHSFLGNHPVWGEVYLWGKIQDYTEGYRAEFAYPKALSTTRADLAETIAAKYGVPVKVVVKTAAMEKIAALPLQSSSSTRIDYSSTRIDYSQISSTNAASPWQALCALWNR